MLNDVQSGERTGLFAFCNYSVSLATDPWSIDDVSSDTRYSMDLGSVINDCGDKHYNTGEGATSPKLLAKPPTDTRVA